jgi:hypothetical protein
VHENESDTQPGVSALLGAAGVAVIAARAGAVPGGHLGYEVGLAIAGAAAAMAGATMRGRALRRPSIRWIAAPTLLTVALLAAYAATFAEPAEHSWLRGSTSWAVVGFADVHASVTRAPLWSDDAIAASGHLWAPSAAFRFGVVWLTAAWLADPWRRSDRRASTTQALLLTAAGGALALWTVALLSATGSEDVSASFTSPLLRSTALLAGASTAMLRRGGLGGLARALRSPRVQAGAGALLLVLAVAPGTDDPVPLALSVGLATLAAAALALGALTDARWCTWVTSHAPRPLQRPLVVIVAFLVHGPILATMQAADLPQLLCLVGTVAVAGGVGIGAVRLVDAALAPRRSEEDVLVLLVPGAVAVALLLWLSTGAFHYDAPAWLPRYGPTTSAPAP